ncbi:MAG TPA: PTS sugar transporter subunit IIA [Acetobacteraceae bacterium]
MDIADFFAADRIALDVRVRDKAQLLQELARRAAAAVPGIAPNTIAEALRAREALGSTGLGHGFALPHARIDGLARFFGLFVRLTRRIDYAAIDGEPVDLVFLLLIPADSATPHVSALAAISRRMRDADARARLRGAATGAAVLAVFTT